MKLIFNIVSLLSLVAAPTAGQGSADSSLGVLVMAHGGDSLWDAAVDSAVTPMRARWPTEVAFGMARRETMAAALARLKAAGVERVAVVPLFVSSESFRWRIQFFLGLRADAPPPMGSSDGPMVVIDHALHVALSDRGLVDDVSIGDLISIRAALASVDPVRESVMVIAHGMREDDANGRLLLAMDELAERVAGAIPFHAVLPATLREDWASSREVAEEAIRSTVRRELEAGRTVVVVPLRLFGFGPYERVLEGLDHRATEGLLPHPIVTEWIERHAERAMVRAGWLSRPMRDAR